MKNKNEEMESMITRAFYNLTKELKKSAPRELIIQTIFKYCYTTLYFNGALNETLIEADWESKCKDRSVADLRARIASKIAS